MKEGIFGGTFDPPHIGHLIAAESARESLGLDRIRFIPAAVPPHKRRPDITPGEKRLEMVRLAIRGNPAFIADDRELRREGTSYTIETIRDLRREFPGVEFTLLIGMDNIQEFRLWKDPEKIRSLAEVAALSRPGAGGIGGPESGGEFRVVTIPLIEVSSSAVRRLVSEGRSIRYLVPPAVEEMIIREGLYGHSPT